MKNFFNRLLMFSVLIVSILALVVFANTVVNSPTTCSGQWTSCSNANIFGAPSATAAVTATANKSGIWGNYQFQFAPIKSSALINSVVVRSDFFASNSRGFVSVRVSGDGGATYGPSHEVGGNTAKQSFFIDVTSDASWTGDKLNDTNFKVNATCFKKGSGTNPTCDLEWIPVNVTYSPFDFSLSANPSSSSVTAGNNATTTVNVSLLGGVAQAVVLSVNSSACPPAATCTLDPASGTPTYQSTLTVATDLTTPAGTYNISVVGTGDKLGRSTVYSLTVN